MSVIVPLNSAQLSQRLARNLLVPDQFNLNADVALDVLNAINGGLAMYYRNVPGIYKRTTLSHTVRRPRQVALTFQSQYSRLVANDTFVVRDQGCTIRFANGSADNIVTGPNSLLDNYLRTDLTVDGTLYSDSVPIQDVIEHIIGFVRLYTDSQAEATIISRDERLRGGRAYSRRGDGEDCIPAFASLNTIGRPQFYYLDPMGASQGAEPEFLLRLAPLPDLDYTIRMEAELATQRLLMSDLTNPREIYVASNAIDDILIPLCEGELITSRWWADKDQKADVKTRQTDALGRIKQLSSDVGPPSHRIGTPVGW